MTTSYNPPEVIGKDYFDYIIDTIRKAYKNTIITKYELKDTDEGRLTRFTIEWKIPTANLLQFKDPSQ